MKTGMEHDRVQAKSQFPTLSLYVKSSQAVFWSPGGKYEKGKRVWLPFRYEAVKTAEDPASYEVKERSTKAEGMGWR